MCACVSMNLCNAGLTRGMDDISLPPSLPPCLSLSLLYAWRHMYLDVCKCVFAYLSMSLACVFVRLFVCIHAYNTYIQTDRHTACMRTDRQRYGTDMHASIHPYGHTDMPT